MRITCPSCKQSDEGFALVRDIRVVTDIDADGVPVGGNDYANEGRHRNLNCSVCGHSWKTSRYFNIEVDVR